MQMLQLSCIQGLEAAGKVQEWQPMNMTNMPVSRGKAEAWLGHFVPLILIWLLSPSLGYNLWYMSLHTREPSSQETSMQRK